MSLIHAGRRTLVFVINNLATALVKVRVEENHLLCFKRSQSGRRLLSCAYLNVGHVVDALQVKVNFVAPTTVQRFAEFSEV